MKKKRKTNNAVKKHEKKYIHVPRTLSYIFCPLLFFVPVIYILWSILMGIITGGILLIYSISVLPLAILGDKGARKEIWDIYLFKKETFKDLVPDIWGSDKK